MNMWLEYEKERRGLDNIETEHGFITFKLVGDECFVEDLFVRGDCRLKLHGTALVTAAKEVAQKAGCKLMTSTIHLETAGAMETLRFHLKYGGRLVSAHNNVIIMAKEI